ncbi:MAG: glycosyltransferase family 8 protein [Chlorobiaceae bacterium]|nr:glycosyltransferase family 8 protein [Chlorobiaceae bacterium]NTW74088.1 glycosyltransferase family 8 protein [Chlorobiaceae bacterium]
MAGRVNIVFAIDNNYVQHVCVAMVSLLENNRDVPFRIYVISSGLSGKNLDNIRSVSEPHDCEVRNITVSDALFVALATAHPFYPKGTYYRLLIPELIDEEKVLYLDSDIVVNGPIRELYEEEFGDNYVCAIEDPGFDRHKQLGMDPDAVYFNSGMMLINLSRWKTDGIQKRVIDFIENNQDVILFPDQCGLNAVINGRWKKVPLKWNQQSSIFSKDFEKKFTCFTPSELKQAKEHPVIIHYTSGSKPWHRTNRHPYKALYWKYIKMTPYRHAIYSDLMPLFLLKSMIPADIRKKVKKMLKRSA